MMAYFWKHENVSFKLDGRRITADLYIPADKISIWQRIREWVDYKRHLYRVLFKPKDISEAIAEFKIYHGHEYVDMEEMLQERDNIDVKEWQLTKRR